MRLVCLFSARAYPLLHHILFLNVRGARPLGNGRGHSQREGGGVALEGAIQKAKRFEGGGWRVAQTGNPTGWDWCEPKAVSGAASLRYPVLSSIKYFIAKVALYFFLQHCV